MTTSTFSMVSPLENGNIAAQKSAAVASNLLKVKGAKAATPEQLDNVSQQFEAQYISQMLGTMYQSVDTKDALGGSDEEDQWRSLLNDQYGKIIAKKGGIGVASQVKNELLKLQEVGEKAAGGGAITGANGTTPPAIAATPATVSKGTQS